MQQRQPHRSTRAMTLAALALALAGCASVAPERDVLPQRAPMDAQLAADIALAREAWPAAQWWTQYQDAQLDGLVRQALAASPTLEVAAARIGTAKVALAYDEGDTELSVAGSVMANRQRYSATGLFPQPIGGGYYSAQTAQVQARYDFDWWGRHRALVAGAVGDVNARTAELALAQQTLAASVVQSYFRLQGDWARVANLRALERAALALVADKAKRIAHGVDTIDTQRTAESQVAELRQQTAQVEAQALHERESLRALVAGSLPDLAPRAPPEPAAGLPRQLGIELLARRPDLQAARWRVAATLGRIDLARAQFYPELDLTAAFGLDTVDIGKLLSLPSRTLLAGATMTLPLFDSRRLQAQLGQARSLRNEAIADYNQAVVEAVRQVAEAGVDVQGLDRQLAQQAGARAAQAALVRSAEARLARGLADRATILAAQIAQLRQRDVELQLRNQRLLADVALQKALGGGFRSDPPAQAAR